MGDEQKMHEVEAEALRIMDNIVNACEGASVGAVANAFGMILGRLCVYNNHAETTRKLRDHMEFLRDKMDTLAYKQEVAAAPMQ